MTLVLIALPLVMFVATFVAGILPLKLTVAQHHLKYLSFLSMGILIGTAMMIILPEGIETISHETTDVALYVGFPILLGFNHVYSRLYVFNQCQSPGVISRGICRWLTHHIGFDISWDY